MKILIAVDGSPPSLRAVQFAVTLCRQQPPTSRSVTLIGVHDDAGLRHAEHFVGHAVVRDYLHELTQKDLEAARAILDSAGIAYTVEAAAR